MPPAMRGAVRFWRPSRRRPDADIVSLPRALSQANGAHHHNRRALLAPAARIVLNRDPPYPHGARMFEELRTLIAIFVPISGAYSVLAWPFISLSGRRATTRTLRTRHSERASGQRVTHSATSARRRLCMAGAQTANVHAGTAIAFQIKNQNPQAALTLTEWAACLKHYLRVYSSASRVMQTNRDDHKMTAEKRHPMRERAYGSHGPLSPVHTRLLTR